MFTKKRIVLLVIIVVLCIVVPILALIQGSKESVQAEEMQVMTLWQIDGFEGGKGSRAQYLSDMAVALYKKQNKYINVIQLTATAAEENIKRGELPDMISCAPTFNAHLQYINSTDFACKSWCNGSYCLLTLSESCTFDDVNASNTVINAGKDNLVSVAAVMCGVYGAVSEMPTNAYLQLLNGKYKYLLGTQRDIIRLKTRGAAFSVKQVSDFNDLYQNISILTADVKRYCTCKQFVEYITESNSDINKLGLFSKAVEKYADELQYLQSCEFKYILNAPCGEEYLSALKSAAANNDINKIKNLLK